MKKEATKPSLSLFLAIACAVFAMSAPAQAQKTPNDYVIYAKAGRVNLVSGLVSLRRAGAVREVDLEQNTELGNGDVVSTGASSHVEVLLNPGSYLRVGDDSEFEVVNTSLEDVHIKLLKGGAVVEASGVRDTRLPITISTPQSKISIPRDGLYRINVTASGSTELRVRKGRAFVSDAYATTVREGQMAVLSGGQPQVAKFRKSDQDALDQWSRARADILFAINRRAARDVRSSWLASFNEDWPVINFPGRSGIWLYNAQTGCYFFMAFYRGFSSPYGYGYPWLINGYNCDSCYYYVPYGGNNGGVMAGGGSSGSGSGRGSGSGSGGGSGSGSGGGSGAGSNPPQVIPYRPLPGAHEPGERIPPRPDGDDTIHRGGGDYERNRSTEQQQRSNDSERGGRSETSQPEQHYEPPPSAPSYSPPPAPPSQPSQPVREEMPVHHQPPQR